MIILSLSQHNFFDSEKLSTICSCVPDAGGVRTSDILDLWLLNPTLYQLSYPVPVLTALMEENCFLAAQMEENIFLCALMDR